MMGSGEGWQRGAGEGSGISPRAAWARRDCGEEAGARRGTAKSSWRGSRVPSVPGPAPPGRPFFLPSPAGGGGAGPGKGPDGLWIPLSTCREVFKAKHRLTGQKVALKKVLMENEKEGVSTGQVAGGRLEFPPCCSRTLTWRPN